MITIRVPKAKRHRAIVQTSAVQTSAVQTSAVQTSAVQTSAVQTGETRPRRRRSGAVRLVVVEPPKREKVKKAWVLEVAKSGRSKCCFCKTLINKGDLRMGVLTFYPHRNCRWHHYGECMHRSMLGATLDRVWGTSKLGDAMPEGLGAELERINATVPRALLPSISGDLDLPRFATSISSRYTRFRSFRFGLPEDQMYTQNWNWRCFIATMLVCNTHETAMLAFTDKFFKVYQTPEQLLSLDGDDETQDAWIKHATKMDLRHAGKKMTNTIKATRTILERFGGEIPNDRKALQAMRGVGRHVASVTMAWVHESPEFGIDTHVSRILERFGYISKDMDEIQVEEVVKRSVPKEQIGAFSRAFVDHGQQVCGFTPDCQNCFLRRSCPTAAKEVDLDW
jgi:endonuclease-3